MNIYVKSPSDVSSTQSTRVEEAQSTRYQTPEVPKTTATDVQASTGKKRGRPPMKPEEKERREKKEKEAAAEKKQRRRA